MSFFRRLTKQNKFKEMEDILSDNQFWEKYRTEMRKVVEPLFRDLLLSGMATGRFIKPLEKDRFLLPEGMVKEKFNPYHDELGRFTFAPGGPQRLVLATNKKPIGKSPVDLPISDEIQKRIIKSSETWYRDRKKREAREQSVREFAEAIRDLFQEWGYTVSWDGTIRFEAAGAAGVKHRDCYIIMSEHNLMRDGLPDTQATLIHEMAHAIGPKERLLSNNKLKTQWIEEASTEIFAQGVIQNFVDRGIGDPNKYEAYVEAMAVFEAAANKQGLWDTDLAAIIKQMHNRGATQSQMLDVIFPGLSIGEMDDVTKDLSANMTQPQLKRSLAKVNALATKEKFNPYHDEIGRFTFAPSSLEFTHLSTKDAAAYYKEIPKTSGLEGMAVEEYGINSYTPINGALRGNSRYKLDQNMQGLQKGLPTTIAENIRLLDSAMKKATLPRDVILHRGLISKSEAISALKVGDIFRDDGYVSTSLDSDVVLEGLRGEPAFAQGHYLRIRAPAGLPVIAGVARQKEIILPRSTSFRVVDVRPGGNLDLEVVSVG